MVVLYVLSILSYDMSEFLFLEITEIKNIAWSLWVGDNLGNFQSWFSPWFQNVEKSEWKIKELRMWAKVSYLGISNGRWEGNSKGSIAISGILNK